MVVVNTWNNCRPTDEHWSAFHIRPHVIRRNLNEPTYKKPLWGTFCDYNTWDDLISSCCTVEVCCRFTSVIEGGHVEKLWPEYKPNELIFIFFFRKFSWTWCQRAKIRWRTNSSWQRCAKFPSKMWSEFLNMRGVCFPLAQRLVDRVPSFTSLFIRTP